jgi:hypothetical protein
MGGEQYAVLAFGPKQSFEVKEWMSKLGIVNKSEFSIKYMKSYYGKELDENNINEINLVFEYYFNEHTQKYQDEFYSLLRKYGLMILHDDNICWESCYIGMEVKDYDKADVKAMEVIREFCTIFCLLPPTFYAGLVGEFE